MKEVVDECGTRSIRQHALHLDLSLLSAVVACSCARQVYSQLDSICAFVFHARPQLRTRRVNTVPGPSTFPDVLPESREAQQRVLSPLQPPSWRTRSQLARTVAGKASRQHHAPGTALSYLRSHAGQQSGALPSVGGSRLHHTSSSRERASAPCSLPSSSSIRRPRLSPRHLVDTEPDAMKLSGILFSSLLCFASAHAQYFSAGWSPGQKAPGSAEQAPPDPAYTFDPAAQAAQNAASGVDAGGKQLGFVDKLLTSGPVVSLFGKLGVNVSDAVARAASPWDERIPFVTDENFGEMIVNEALTAEEERERVWFLIISVTGSQNSEISKIVDKSFDDAYNQTVIAGDLPHVRWGRIDYMAVTYLTTKWSIWTGPYLVVLRDRGQTLRFYKADRVRVSVDLIRELLTEELWRETPIWNSNFAPGGKREFVLEYYALAMMHIFNVLNRIPRFLLMIASGGVASIVMRFLHKPQPQDPNKKQQPQQQQQQQQQQQPQQQQQQQPHAESTPKKDAQSEAGTTVSGTTAVASSTATSSPKKGKQRKTGKTGKK